MGISDYRFLRIKLTSKGKELFWRSIDEEGGIKKISEEEQISQHKLYSWKSKDSFLPVRLVEKYLDDWKNYLKSYKGQGRSKPISKPRTPIPIDEELLTRREVSVNINNKGTPIYQTTDHGLLDRFSQLIQIFGDVPVKIYYRDVYELRYPSYLDKIMRSVNFSKDYTALVDESGKVTDSGDIILNGEEAEYCDVGELYSREKRMKIALANENKNEIARLMGEEKEKVRKALNHD